MIVATGNLARIWHGTHEEVQTTNKAQVTDLGLILGAGDGNRTRALSLGSSCSTIKLHPRDSPWQAIDEGYFTPCSAPGAVTRGAAVLLGGDGRKPGSGGGVRGLGRTVGPRVVPECLV
jgi:hypothetical protein